MIAPVARAKKKPKKPKPPASLTAHACTVLAIDPGETSGWAIWSKGILRGYGTCDVFGDSPAALIRHVLSRYEHQGPHCAVIERPFLVRFGTQTNIGTADRIWRKRLEEAGLARRIVRVYPASWRARVLGKSWASASRDLVRAREQVVAGGIAETTLIHPDAAAAVCIGRWGSFAGEVGAVLPRSTSRKRKS